MTYQSNGYVPRIGYKQQFAAAAGGGGVDPGAPDYLWQMNETSGTRVAVRGMNLPTASGDPTFESDGKFGNAAHFDGTSLSGTNFPVGSGDTTIEAISFWIRPHSAGTGVMVMGHNFSDPTPSVSLWAGMDVSGGTFSWNNCVEPATFTVPGGIIAETWYHFYGTFQDGDPTPSNIGPLLSIDNGTFAEPAFGGALPATPSSDNWRFGSNGDGTVFIDADIDQLAIWTTRGTIENGEFLYNGGAGVALS